MNLVQTLAREHSKAQCSKIVDFIGSDPERFARLVKVFLSGPYRITQRAAWPLSKCVEDHPELIRPHLKALLQSLRKPSLHDAVKRNTVRLLQFVVIPRSLVGLAAKTCFDLFQDNTEPIAVRVFSMTVLGQIAQSQPELKTELIMLIEDQLPYASSGFVSRARRVLKQLKA